MSSVVVRFAPSPTGPPHLGSLRTALFDWLLARATGGRFILRIDDTDRKRYSADAEAQMIEALRWLGLDWDEGPDVGGDSGPYRQSERLALYYEAADRLMAGGHAYRPADEPEIVRLKVPDAGSITFYDALRGKISFDYSRVPEDPVLLKSDGYPTYHLASVVDDYHMQVTHILRGEEWIPSTPLHLQLFEAFGWPAPKFVHLPLVTDTDGQKMKKRDPRANVSHYIEMGIFPQAMMNYLALLGWHPGIEREIYSPKELIAHFGLKRLSKSASAFDENRLRWFNRQYLAALTSSELVELVGPRIIGAYPEASARDTGWLLALVSAVRDEFSTLSEVADSVRFAFEPVELTAEAQEALNSEQARPVLEAFLDELAAADPPDFENSTQMLKALRKRFKDSHGWGGRAVMFPLRAALTGSVRGPHLSDVVALLGKEECQVRVNNALTLL